MDGIVGLIIFAVISFVYNKITQNQDAKNAESTDLSEWLEEVEESPQNAPPPPPKPVIDKKKSVINVPKIENIKKNPSFENYASPLPVFENNISKQDDTYRTVHNKNSESTEQEHFTKTKRNKRHSLNYKNKKTLRQAFILNTVLSKAKSYEP